MTTQTIVQDEDVDLARPFLAERGVYPDEAGRYSDEAIIDAIRARGWEPEAVETPGDWTVEFANRRDPTQERSAVTSAEDPNTALLRALHLALTWMTPEEARQHFDKSARYLLGLSGEEFVRRWHAGELDPDDPSVEHLLIGMPIGR